MAKKGILITNLGTPNAPTPKAIRAYLKTFLSDTRVVDAPRLIWFFVLRVILAIRPRVVAKGYQAVWTERGSPLLAITQDQARALQAVMGDTPVEFGMRYGNPSIPSALDALMAAGVEDITVLPLYPQYSATTSASTFDAIADWAKQQRCLPSLRFIRDYHDNPQWIAALANSVREHWQQNGRAEKLLLSFHGIPQRYCDLGDPYFAHCQRGAELLAEALELNDDEWAMSFQSRVGREEWLQPYTESTLKTWAKSGMKTVDVICPGFSADCLETLEEIQQENAEYFSEAGGQDLRYIAALNSRDDHISALAEIIKTA